MRDLSAIQSADFAILDFIQAHMRSPFLDKIMPFITHLGAGGVLFIIFVIVLMCTKKYRREGFSAAAALTLSFVFCNILIKNIVARTRPFDINTSIELLIRPPVDYSFPSGHTAAAFAVATALLLCKNKLLGIPVLIIAVLIAFSRLYLYVHFPSDVLGGMILGIIVAFAANMIVNKMWKKKSRAA